MARLVLYGTASQRFRFVRPGGLKIVSDHETPALRTPYNPWLSADDAQRATRRGRGARTPGGACTKFVNTNRAATSRSARPTRR
jgi:hypothetical protein